VRQTIPLNHAIAPLVRRRTQSFDAPWLLLFNPVLLQHSRPSNCPVLSIADGGASQRAESRAMIRWKTILARAFATQPVLTLWGNTLLPAAYPTRPRFSCRLRIGTIGDDA